MSESQYTPPQDPRSAKAQAKADKAYRKASRPFYKKPWFILLAVIVVIVVIVVATTGGDDSASSESTQPAGPSFAGQQEDDVSANAGEAIDLNGVSVTSTPLADAENPLGTGGIVCTTVTIENGTDDSVNFNGGFDWSMQDPNGASRNTNFAGSDNFLGAGDLVAGGNVTGDVCFDIDAAVAGTYVVLYSPTFSFSSDRAAWVNAR